MKSDTIKTVILFSVVAFVFCGLVVGGIHFIKSRNSSYAATQTPSADSGKQTNPESKTANSPASQAQSKAEQPVASAPAQTAPVEAANAPVVSPDAVVETGPQSMPATGAGLGDFMLTIALMMIAAFFGGQLLRAKNSYRRLYSADS